MNSKVVGIDFGNGVIRVAEVKRQAKGRPVLVQYRETIVPKSAIREGVVTDSETVTRALRRLWTDYRISTKHVVLGMGSQQVLTRELSVPRMSLDRIREALPFRVQELLPLPVEDAVLDFFPVEDVESEEGPLVRGLLVAATREAVHANVRAVEDAGLRVEDVDLIPFAISRVHLTPGAASGTQVLLHVGAVSSSIIVVTDGVPRFVRVLPSGGADLTAAVAERLSIHPSRADELKRHIGLVDDGSDPTAAAVASVGIEAAHELVRAVESTLAFYQNAHPETVLDAIVLSGGGGQLRGLGEAISTGTGLPVRVGQAGAAFALDRGVDEESLVAAGSAPEVALGLTMRSAA